MKLVATSDLHGQLPPALPAGDILLIAGDLLPDEHPENWLDAEFTPWLRQLDFRTVLFIAGNHDFYFQSAAWQEGGIEHFQRLGAHYLQDCGVTIGGLNFWGTPWLENLANWAFVDRQRAAEAYREIPVDTDILLSHGPPAGILDAVGRQSTGSTSLASRLQRVAPRAVVFGHIHECRGQSATLGETQFHNVAYLDQDYRFDQRGAPRRITY